MLIGSLVELHAWLHSYMCFSLLEKLFLSNLDSFLTPPRHLAIYRVFQLLIIAILIASQQLGGSIDKISGPSIASRQLVDWSSFFIIFSVELFLNKSLTVASVEAFYAWHLSRNLLTPLFVEIYWTTIYSFRVIHFSFCSILLSIYPFFHLPNFSHSLQTSSSRFLQAFSRFSLLGKLLISHIHAFHALKPRIWGFLKKFWVFQNCWVFVEILGWILKIWS